MLKKLPFFRSPAGQIDGYVFDFIGDGGFIAHAVALSSTRKYLILRWKLFIDLIPLLAGDSWPPHL